LVVCIRTSGWLGGQSGEGSGGSDHAGQAPAASPVMIVVPYLEK